MYFPQNVLADTLNVCSWQLIVLSLALLLPIPYFCCYGHSIHQRVKQIEETFSKPLMVREQAITSTHKKFRLLELNPDFAQKYQDEWSLVSLGDYLSTLRLDALPKGVDAPQVLQKELEVLLGSTLLNYLGPHLGRAVLPMFGFANIQSTTSGIASHVATWFASHFLVDFVHRPNKDSTADKGIFPFSLFDLSAFANLNRQLLDREINRTPLSMLQHGEVGYSPTITNDLLPNPFVVEEHWDRAVVGMEYLLKQSSVVCPIVAGSEGRTQTQLKEDFDPDDRSFPDPKAINHRLFPDLYIGWGSAKCTHTKREIVRNRLLAVLLNRLSYNYVERENESTERFKVLQKKGAKAIETAHGFISALTENGHKIEVCPRGTLTTFGLSMCIKESDNSWSNIPLACFMRTGYESRMGQSAYVGVPHGGMDLRISGPITGPNCSLQFYMAIEGMCGWHSNHIPDVPWIKPTASTDPYPPQKALQAIRMASLLSVCFSLIGTEQNLPFGGYGVLGVCNDTAALLDEAIRGNTNMYPLVSTGAFLMHISSRLRKMHSVFVKENNLREESIDVLKLHTATIEIESDLHAAPSNLRGSVRRYFCSLPEMSPFKIELETRRTLAQLLESFDD